MSVFQAMVLGLVQGLSEFFPISSSGHLIVLPHIFGWEDQGLAFDVILHLGTLCALIWHFWPMLWTVCMRAQKPGPARSSARRLLAQLAFATLPALVFGYLLRDVEESLGRRVPLVAFDLAVWGVMLFIADRYSRRIPKPIERIETDLSWKQALTIGGAQAIALLPGTSRSGITMTTGLFTGLSREAAARFSFLLSIPITTAAGAHGLFTLITHPEKVQASMPALMVGFFSAALSGAWAIRFLLGYVAKKPYDVFVAYRLFLAFVLVCFFLR